MNLFIYFLKKTDPKHVLSARPGLSREKSARLVEETDTSIVRVQNGGTEEEGQLCLEGGEDFFDGRGVSVLEMRRYVCPRVSCPLDT